MAFRQDMRSDPKVEVTYRNKTIRAIAREASDDERQPIWDRATTIYAGYEAYASRIKNREIHIMILSAEGPGNAASPGTLTRPQQ